MSDEAVRQAWRVIQRADRFPIPVSQKGLAYNPNAVAAVSNPVELSDDEDRWWGVIVTFLVAASPDYLVNPLRNPLIDARPRFDTRADAQAFVDAFHVHWARQS